MVADVRAEGPEFLKRFSAPPEDLLWYYGGIRAAFREDLPPALLGEFRAVVLALSNLTRAEAER